MSGDIMLKQRAIALITILTAAAAFLLIGPGCGNNEDGDPPTTTDQVPDDTLAAAVSREQFIVTPRPDAATTLLLKRQEIFSWAPREGDRIERVLKDVTRIIMLRELGLGEQLEVTLPRRAEGLATGHSVRLRLDADRTALALRFAVDTLPGHRVRGEGLLGIFAVHASDSLGREVDVERTQTGTGRLDLAFKFEQIIAKLSCCEMPPTFLFSGMAEVGDTLAILVVFDRSGGKYVTTIVGPKHSQTYSARSYVNFRTERGEFHKDMREYPYMYQTTDPGWVNLFLGSRWRGKKRSTEPILTARIF